MKDIKNWSSLLKPLAYILSAAIMTIKKQREYKLLIPTPKDAEKEPIEFKLKDALEYKLPSPGNAYVSKAIPIKSKWQIKSDKTEKKSNYPGINKLLLSTQEKDPYKFYPKSPIRDNKLNKILNKYSASKKLLIMSELFQHKFEL